MKAKTPRKKRNLNDATLINVRAAKARLERLELEVETLQLRVKRLEALPAPQRAV